MRLWSDSFTEGGVLPAECAFACVDPARRMRLAANRNPHLAWDDVPAATHSLALFCRDVDAPVSTEHINQPGQHVPANLPRVDFYHWILVDIPPELHAVGEGRFSELVTPHGKGGPLVPFMVKNGIEHQLRQGLNDYTTWLAGDPDMAGEYYGYDGPCPPWNDERPHAYVFTLYALDTSRFPLEGRFTGAQARQALRGHILDEAQTFCVYSLNPQVVAGL
ncbi:YbhB/YbcL family Raf kinase inhibitor-like protein [Massilia sp. DWR3-1-1]|uniref:YbhB/YbcL family Raf kinase inhibitor-like protein n=1 Tax=Massilia sp. DWR3-1-1 TaxID=2804559 RepID=UPI003CF19250